MMYKIRLFFHTLYHLKIIQIFYQIYYTIVKFVDSKPLNFLRTKSDKVYFLKYNIITENKKYKGNNTFVFLNIQHTFKDKVDWEFLGYGKLWQYNLAYFDFLNNSELSQEEGVRLIKDFISFQDNLKSSNEPYPISLRLINWIRFISNKQIDDSEILNAIFVQAYHLTKRIEYHLLGNHLLENAFCLLHISKFFKNTHFLLIAKNILFEQLNEQILEDGAHFELSPMYHQIILYRLLEAIDILESNYEEKDFNLIQFLSSKASDMLGWLNKITFINGDIPLVNDSANGVSLSTSQLQDLAKKLNIKPSNKKLNTCGYRKYLNENYEAFVDVGVVGPSYQPGHAHADTLNLILYIKQEPILVEAGTSTYQIGKRRHLERSTESHNTVVVNGSNQSEVWSGFRVAQRATPRIIKEGEYEIVAQHDGYSKVVHQRELRFSENYIMVKDIIVGKVKEAVAHWHFHPNVSVKIDDNKLLFDKGKIVFENSTLILCEEYYFAPEFNKLILSRKVKVKFQKTLTTKIYIN